MKVRSFYTKRLGRSVASQAHPKGSLKYHVIMGDSKWSVVVEGRLRALRVFSTVDEAVAYAKEIATEKESEVVIHEESGRIRNRISFHG